MQPQLAQITPELHAAIGTSLAEPQRAVRSYVAYALTAPSLVAVVLTYASFGGSNGDPYATLVFAREENPELDEWHQQRTADRELIYTIADPPAIPPLSPPPRPPLYVWRMVHRLDMRQHPLELA